METFATLFERFLVFVSHCFDRIVIQWALSNHPAGSGQAHSTRRLRGKLYSVLEKLDRGHHVMRVYCKNLVGRMYEKFSAFLRVEACVNRMNLKTAVNRQHQPAGLLFRGPFRPGNDEKRR